jgi:hypothetical protein
VSVWYAGSELLFVPFHTLVELDARPTEYVQGAPNGQVDLGATQALHKLQVLERAAASSVGDGDSAPLAQLRDQLVVNATLQALDVGGVDQELGAVGLEEANALCRYVLAAFSPAHFTHLTQAED